MSFDSSGYLLTPDGGPQLWFLDARMNIKAGGAQSGGAFTLIEWSAPAASAPLCTSMASMTRGSTSSTAANIQVSAPNAAVVRLTWSCRASAEAVRNVKNRPLKVSTSCV